MTVKICLDFETLESKVPGFQNLTDVFFFCSVLLCLVIASVLEGKLPDDGLLQRLQSDTVTEDTLSCLYAGLYSLLRSALRLPQTSLKPEQFKADLTELK